MSTRDIALLNRRLESRASKERRVQAVRESWHRFQDLLSGIDFMSAIGELVVVFAVIGVLMLVAINVTRPLWQSGR